MCKGLDKIAIAAASDGRENDEILNFEMRRYVSLAAMEAFCRFMSYRPSSLRVILFRQVLLHAYICFWL